MSWKPPLRTNGIRQAWSKQARAKALEAYRRIAKRTPVLTGTAKNNWFITTNAPVDTVSFSGQIAHDFDMRAIENFAPIFVQNNVPYIIPLEYGSSKKSPAGMVRVTVAELASR